MPRSPLPPLVRGLVRSFLRLRRAQGIATSTIEGHELHLRRFVYWLETAKPALRSLVELDQAVLEEYAVHLAVFETDDGHRLKASTRHGQLSTLAVFFRWLEKCGRILRSPAEDLALPKVPEQLPRGVLTAKEIERVLAVPDLATATGLRARAIFEVLYSTGIRNSELRGLRLSDLNLAEGLVTVHLGKGAKDRVVPLGKTAARFLLRYLEKARPGLVRSRFENHVFLSRFGKPFSKTQLIMLMEKTGKRAGLGKPLTCHGLRHTCATHLLRGRADIRHIQELLGHRSLASTQLYTHVAVADLKKVHARCHPRERAAS